MPSVHRPCAELAIDHLVVAARSLAEGTAWLRERIGADAQAGGAHVAMGTHNAIVGLGPRRYIEVIAIDPAAVAPARPRWFALDDPGMRARLADGPALVHWVVRTRDIDTDATRTDLGPIITMTRGDFTWRITVPGDGHLPQRGLVPTLIQWADARHPADRLADPGLSLMALAGEHPEPAPVRSAVAALGLSDILKVSYGRSPRLAAMLRTPRGVATL